MKKVFDSLLSAAVLLGSLSIHLSVAIEDKDGNLRRKRVENRFEVRPEVAKGEFMLKAEEKSEEHLEDLWSRAIALDEDERRYLQMMGMSMSMPTGPPVEQTPTTSPSPSASVNSTESPSGPTSNPPTGLVDCLSGTTKSDYLVGVLSPISDSALLGDPNSPQGRALAFLVDDTNFDPCISQTIEQRYSLATFFFATNGQSWTSSTGWVSTESECEWLGVTCGNGTVPIIERLQLPLNTIGGTLPNEISALTDLLRIDLFGNDIAGALPTTISSLTNLELLDLEENALTGQLFTPEILALTNLIGLRGSFNSFTGQIPTTISSLSRLEQLWFADNRIDGTIPQEVTNLSSLESLFGYRNALSGAIPAGFGGLVNFTQIRLYQNSLTGLMPPDLFDATNLETIRLDDNQVLTGTIPTTIGNLLALEDLRLYNNTIFGEIPAEIGNLPVLQNLILNNNFLSGTLADATFSASSVIEFIDLSNNAFLAGPIPSSLFTLPLLKNLYLANCTLTGSIPTNFGTPPALRDLYLDGNSLVGPVPEIQTGQLLALNEFLIQNNEITGSMPASICALRDNSTGVLEDLWSDCLGDPPEIMCDFPGCCNRCFDGSATI